MNAHQRAVSQMRRHRLWPLGAEVAVLSSYEVPHRYVLARGWIFRHPSGCDTCCEVKIPGPPGGLARIDTINFRALRLVDTRLRGQRPWFKQRPWSNGTP